MAANGCCPWFAIRWRRAKSLSGRIDLPALHRALPSSSLRIALAGDRGRASPYAAAPPATPVPPLEVAGAGTMTPSETV